MPTAVRIEVLPKKRRLLVDDELTIRFDDLLPGRKVTIHTRINEGGTTFESCCCFVADKMGVIDLSTQPSISGSYTGISPMGLFWSMTAAPGQRKGVRIMKRNVQVPFFCMVHVYAGHLSRPPDRGVEPLGSSVIERWYTAPGVREIVVRVGRIRGILYLPPGPGPFPGLIEMFGTVGGVVKFRSALLASRGFASLALAYFAYDDLPESFESLDLDYFMEAADWLAAQSEVIPGGIGCLGVSKGGEIALLLGAYSDKVNAVVDICGLPFLSSTDMPFGNEVIKSVVIEAADVTLPNGAWSTNKSLHYTRDIITPIWRRDVKLLHIVGGDDQNGPSETAYYLRDTCYPPDRRHNMEILDYPGAGHLIEPPYTPLCSISFHILLDSYWNWGGHPAAHAYAQEHSWRRILTFLRDHIGSNDSTCSKSKL